MATTKYTVSKLDENGKATEVGTKSKRQPAVDLARDTRKAERVAVQVVTQAGNVVLDLPAPKRIKMSPKYTRVVGLPEGAFVPEGLRVAYTRSRKNIALTHDAETGEYALVNYVTGDVIEEGLQTSREAGAAVKAVPELAKA